MKWLLLCLLLLLPACGFAPATATPEPPPKANLVSGAGQIRIWGKGPISTDSFKLEASNLLPRWEAFESSDNPTPCPMHARLKGLSFNRILTDDGKSSELPGFFDGPVFHVSEGMYTVDVTTGCEWVIILEYAP